MKDWRIANPIAARAIDARRYDPARTAAWRAKNPLKLSEHQKRYYESNKGKFYANNMLRKCSKAKRTPSWVDKEALQEVYRNCPKGHHVDHIVPLRGKNVSGLHVPWNLQYLPAKENLRKNNKWSV